MPSRPTDPGIPTLTQRVNLESVAPARPDDHLAPMPDQQAARHALPVLTERAHADIPPWDDIPTLDAVIPEASAPQATPDSDLPFSTAPLSSDAQAAVLRAALQAELEQVMQIALEEAIQGIRTRMDTELPGIVTRVLDRVRPG